MPLFIDFKLNPIVVLIFGLGKRALTSRLEVDAICDVHLPFKGPLSKIKYDHEQSNTIGLQRVRNIPGQSGCHRQLESRCRNRSCYSTVSTLDHTIFESRTQLADSASLYSSTPMFLGIGIAGCVMFRCQQTYVGAQTSRSQSSRFYLYSSQNHGN